MARESKPFRDRNPVPIGAISLGVIALLVFLAFNAQNAAAHRRGHRLQGAVLRGRRPPARRPGARGRCEGRQGREPGARGRRRHGRVPGQGRLRRRPVRGRHQDRDGAGREVPGTGAARIRGAGPRPADPAGPDRVPLRRRRGVRRPVHDRRGHRHRAAGQLLRGDGGDLRRHPGRGAHLPAGPGAPVGHDRLPRRPARAAAVGDAAGHAGPRRPERRVHPADRRLQHAAHRGPGTSGADRLDPDQHAGAVPPAVGAGRRQPRGADPGAAAAVDRSPTSCRATGRRWPRP